MANASQFVQTMKKAALDAMEASKPVNVYFGEVRTIKPLTINVEQKMILGESQLILTRNLTDFVTMATINWEAEEEKTDHYHNISNLEDSNGDTVDGKTEKQSKKHSHMITGEKQITLQNGLAVGDEVILIRQQKGQKFIVLDRIGK